MARKRLNGACIVLSVAPFIKHWSFAAYLLPPSPPLPGTLQYIILPSSTSHCITMNYTALTQCHYNNIPIALVCIAFLYYTLHCVASQRITSYCIVLNCMALYCIVLHCIALYCIVLHCIALYCIVLHCIALYCIVLNCITLYCIFIYHLALQCNMSLCITSYNLELIVLKLLHHIDFLQLQLLYIILQLLYIILFT